MKRKKPTMLQILKEDTKVFLEREEERGVQKIAIKHGLRTALIRYMVRNGLITREGTSEMDNIILSFCEKVTHDEILATYFVSGFDPETKYMISYLCTFITVLPQNIRKE